MEKLLTQQPKATTQKIMKEGAGQYRALFVIL
jgi:hypothetical protein